jgi:hypothetical protein
MDDRSRHQETDPFGLDGRRPEDPAARRAEAGSRAAPGGYGHPAEGFPPTSREAEPHAAEDRHGAGDDGDRRDRSGDPTRDPGERAYGRHGGDSTGFAGAGYAGISEHRYGGLDRRRAQRRRADDVGMGAPVRREETRDAWRPEGGYGAASAGGRPGQDGPYRDGWGRDDDYRSSGRGQGPHGSGAEHESGYGQQPTHARGGYGEGSGFTGAGQGRGYATGYRPEAYDPGPEGDAGTPWSREQTHGTRERGDETARRESWPRERDGELRARHGQVSDARDALDRERMRNRGPRAYKRSDERIREDIYERLIDAWEIDSSDVTVEVREGRVTLQGAVPERRMKHRIEDLVDGCHGVHDIDNFIRVRRAGEDGWAAAPADGVRAAAPAASATSSAGQMPGSDRPDAAALPARVSPDDVARDQPAATSGDRGLGSSSADAPDGSAAGTGTGKS